MASSKFKHETIIHTSRLLIRPIRASDVDFIWEARCHRDIYKWAMAGQWPDKSKVEEWITSALEVPENYNFIIELQPPTTPVTAQDKPTSITIGSVGLFGSSELGYLIHPDFWNTGYASEAVAAFIAAVWQGLPHVSQITGEVDIANAGSMRVLRKCGFEEIKREPYDNVTLGKRVRAIVEIARP